MRRHSADFEKRGARIVAISPAEGKSAESVCGMFNIPFQCLGDPTGEAYDAFGLRRGNLNQMFSFRTFFRGALAFFRGHRQGPALGDRFSLPGVFIIAPGGGTQWAWRGRDPADHPGPRAILSALDETSGGGGA